MDKHMDNNNLKAAFFAEEGRENENLFEGADRIEETTQEK